MSETSIDFVSDEELARKLEAAEEAYALSSQGQDFDCLLCLEEKRADEGKRLHCGHMICLDCFKDFTQTIVEKTDLLHCPSCNEVVTSGEIRSVLGPDIAIRYETIELIKLRQETGLFHCLTPDCQNSVFAEDGINKFYCEVCHATYCIQCKSPFHVDETCDEYQEKLRQRKIDQKSASDPLSSAINEEYLEKLLKAGNLKQCSCGNYIEKNGGCWYILCPMCHLGFCWKCNKILGDGTPNCRHTKGHIANPNQWNVTVPIARVQGVRTKKRTCSVM
eukprot:TRINITY_DN8970_c0_g1_i1.p1 TRINITY_DN8970_c0_g1~~TRINITY_DN8970_c0_g1_i1.p1  ORF type:complete len:277 (+),score=35.63 TRINITY_DN8970_c0_g1_i1:157-987(+)